jgi:hypothetical protein
MNNRSAVLMVGRRFGRLVVQAPARDESGVLVWNVLCDCGTRTTARGHHLRAGRSRSCGCLKREVTASRNAARARHGEARSAGPRSAEYGAWTSMIARCERRGWRDFRHYGGRGIRVCERWRRSYEAFLADMGRRPSPEHSLDRINVNGHYEPENCRWATRTEQRHNQRRMQA